MLCSVWHALCTRSVQKRTAAFCLAAFRSATLVWSCWCRSTQKSNHSSVRDALCSVCPCSAQFTRSVHALCSRALFRNVRPHSVRPHSARPHSFGHAGVGPHSGPIIAQSETLCSVCPCSAQFIRSVHALCSETFGRIMFGRIETVRMRPEVARLISAKPRKLESRHPEKKPAMPWQRG